MLLVFHFPGATNRPPPTGARYAGNVELPFEESEVYQKLARRMPVHVHAPIQVIYRPKTVANDACPSYLSSLQRG